MDRAFSRTFVGDSTTEREHGSGELYGVVLSFLDKYLKHFFLSGSFWGPFGGNGCEAQLELAARIANGKRPY